ncbi:MAG: hypothetical protein IT381_14160 [Deltaproteobacteria bacterium]|nr:hypothetical protein [Deltaproteobacteria bacterium]
MAQTGFLGCWKCGEISVAGALEELPIVGLTTSVYCCLECAGDLSEAMQEQPLTLAALRDWRAPLQEEAPALTGAGDPTEPRRPMIGIVVRSAGEELFRTGEFVASSVEGASSV